MTDLLQPTPSQTPFAWSLPVPETQETDRESANLRTDAFASSTSTGLLSRSRQSGMGVSCWKAVLADLLDQALTVDAFIEAARQEFGESCMVVPIGDGISMQQIMPPQRIIITKMVNDMVTEASCY
jgi:hypothetical protein